MEIEINIAELRKNKIFLATPMFGGMCGGQYTKSCTDLATFCGVHQIPLKFFFLFNESLVTRARNYCVDEFLRSDCTHMVFIDADIGFSAEDIIVLIALANEESEYDIICGPYAKKTIAWEKIKTAVDKGFADEDPNKLEKFVGDYVFNPAPGQDRVRLDEPVEVLEGGTGFMVIRRKTFEKFEEAYPELKYRPDHVRTKHFDGSRQIMAYFDTVICPDSNRYLSEDYMFCQWSRKIGLKVWLCPWMKASHMGSYMFAGSLIDIAQIGESATADIDKLNKIKNRKKKKK
jgi:hypothetical protein